MSDIPDLLTIREVQAVFRRNYRAVLRRVRTHLAPMGGVVKIGPRYLVHRWAVEKYLSSLTVKPGSPQRRMPVWFLETCRRPRKADPAPVEPTQPTQEDP